MTTPEAVSCVQIDDPALAWKSSTIPGSTSEVSLVRLHVDTASGQSVQLVRFPVGWQRPAVGHYACAEEFVVLDGSLRVSDVVYAAGSYGYLAPRTSRWGSAAGPDGCLALAWFSGIPRWNEGPSEVPVTHDDATGDVTSLDRPRRQEVQGAAIVGEAPAVRDVDRDALWLTSRAWAFLPAGAMLPGLEGPVLVRDWY